MCVPPPSAGEHTINSISHLLTSLYNEIARKDNIFSDFFISDLLNRKTLVFEKIWLRQKIGKINVQNAVNTAKFALNGC